MLPKINVRLIMIGVEIVLLLKTGQKIVVVRKRGSLPRLQMTEEKKMNAGADSGSVTAIPREARSVLVISNITAGTIAVGIMIQARQITASVPPQHHNQPLGLPADPLLLPLTLMPLVPA